MKCGRSIHEQRILEQRSGAYSGRIASNASFLIEYLLMLAISPTVEIEELPIKMWGRYLSDAYAQAVWRLFGITLGLDLFDPLAAPPAHVAVPYQRRPTRVSSERTARLPFGEPRQGSA